MSIPDARIGSSTDQLLATWRRGVATRILLVVGGGGLALVLSVGRILQPSVFWSSAATAFGLVVVALWPPVPTRVRAIAASIGLAYGGTTGLLGSDDIAGGMLYLMSAALFAAMLVSTRAGNVFLGYSALVLAFAVFDSSGPVRMFPRVNVAEPTRLYSLTSDAIGFLVVCLALLTSISSLTRRLRTSVEEEARARRESERRSEELEVANRQLRESQTRLVQAAKLELVGQLSGALAHDLNNTLTSVMLEASALERQAPEAARVIHEAVGHADGLTRQLLGIGRRDQAPENLDLATEIERSLGLVGRKVPAKVTVVRSLVPGLVVKAERGKITQVVVNLVVNALDAMQAAGGTLDVATRRDGDTVVLRVRDTGPGMDAETLARAFEPFFTTKPEGVGSGLGLASVRILVEEMGGTVRAESSPGAGAVFEVRLPVAAA